MAGSASRCGASLRRWPRCSALKAGSSSPGLSLKPGARLVREWHGRTHTITVTEDGFEYNGFNDRSLTIPRQHWSGRRFFGSRRGSRANNGGDNG